MISVIFRCVHVYIMVVYDTGEQADDKQTAAKVFCKYLNVCFGCSCI